MRPFQQITALSPMASRDAPMAPDASTQLLHDSLDDSLNDECGCGVCDVDLSEQDFCLNDEGPSSDLGESACPEEQLPDENLGYKSKIIKSSAHEKADVRKVAQNCNHLSQTQRNDLENLLCKCERPFDGKLKEHSGDRIHLQLNDDAEPFRT